MELNEIEFEFWNSYLETVNENPCHPYVEVSIAGNDEIADELLALYLNGKKTAGSSLVTDFEQAGDPLPRIGDYWIILDKEKKPRCIVKTIRIEFNQFDEMTDEIAKAEGEGDLSLTYWRKAHIEFFTPYLEGLGIKDLEKEKVITEFYEVVYKS